MRLNTVATMGEAYPIARNHAPAFRHLPEGIDQPGPRGPTETSRPMPGNRPKPERAERELTRHKGREPDLVQPDTLGLAAILPTIRPQRSDVLLFADTLHLWRAERSCLRPRNQPAVTKSCPRNPDCHRSTPKAIGNEHKISINQPLIIAISDLHPPGD